MSSWMIKTAVQHCISRLPKSYWWNSLLQKYITKRYYPTQTIFCSKLSYCKTHHDHYLQLCSAPKSSFKALELGTGPWPIVPIGLYLLKVTEIWTYDLVPLLQKDALEKTLELFHDSYQTGVLEKILGPIDPQRISNVILLLKNVKKETPVQLLERLNVHVCVGDARAMNHQDGSFDLIFSTVVFEHIKAEVLNDLLLEFQRVASPHAIMSHYIGLSDQYASFDSSITPYNFLQYSERQWQILNNPLIPLSRLRIADYRKVFNQTKWEIVKEKNIFGSQADLKNIKLASQFQKHSTEDLLVLYSWLVARQKESSSEELALR